MEYSRTPNSTIACGIEWLARFRKVIESTVGGEEIQAVVRLALNLAWERTPRIDATFE